MINTLAYSHTTLRCWSDWLVQVAGKLQVSGAIRKHNVWLVLLTLFLQCHQPTWIYLDLPGLLMFTGRNSMFSHRSFAPRNVDAALLGLHSIGGALCPADGPCFERGVAFKRDLGTIYLVDHSTNRK